MMWLVPLLSSCVGLIYAEEPERNYDAIIHTWKWQVSLQYDSSNQGNFSHMCGGSLIEPMFVMTAAHCIVSMDVNHYRVVVGEYDLYELEGTEQYAQVAKIMVHPLWTGNVGDGNDIAILKLTEHIYDNGYVDLADFPSDGQTLPHDFSCYITGWGVMDYKTQEAHPIMQEVPIKVVEHKVCSSPEWWGVRVRTTMVCAGGDAGISGCQGDSGGPLNCLTDGAWRVHGVVSYGVVTYGPSGDCNQVTKPIVFTKVSSFRDWIWQVTLN